MDSRGQASSKDRHCRPAPEVNVKTGMKEGMMKKFIFIIVAFILMSIFIGCAATMTPEQRKETYDLRQNVGNQPFVGSPKNLDAKGLMPMLAY